MCSHIVIEPHLPTHTVAQTALLALQKVVRSCDGAFITV